MCVCLSVQDGHIASVLEAKRKEVNDMIYLIGTTKGTHSFLHQLKTLLLHVDDLIKSIGVRYREV